MTAILLIATVMITEETPVKLQVTTYSEMISQLLSCILNFTQQNIFQFQKTWLTSYFFTELILYEGFFIYYVAIPISQQPLGLQKWHYMQKKGQTLLFKFCFIHFLPISHPIRVIRLGARGLFDPIFGGFLPATMAITWICIGTEKCLSMQKKWQTKLYQIFLINTG